MLRPYGMDEALRQALSRLIRNNKDVLLDDDVVGDAANQNAADIRTIEAAIAPKKLSTLAETVALLANRRHARCRQPRAMEPYI